MNTDATSLDRLHDIVVPPAVSMWPLAAGWYVLLSMVFIVAVYFGLRFWRRWQTNGYRREALRQLAKMDDVFAIAKLLRRTALAVVPRTELAQKTGMVWADWLASQNPNPMPSEVRRMLGSGVYGLHDKQSGLNSLRNYAKNWITYHMFSKPFTKKSGE
jgi:hypothetical protein